MQGTERYIIIAKAKGVEITVELPDELMIETHLESFKKAISNILSNAVINTDAGKSISVTVHNQQLEIWNSCVPIPQEHLKL